MIDIIYPEKIEKRLDRSVDVQVLMDGCDAGETGATLAHAISELALRFYFESKADRESWMDAISNAAKRNLDNYGI